MVEKVIRNGMVAVLVSPGFGAGWSTWDSHEGMEFDPKLVEWVEEGKPGFQGKYRGENYGVPKDLATYLSDKYEDAFLGGVGQLEIEWVSEGTAFRITEYDGSESIEYKDTYGWNFA